MNQKDGKNTKFLLVSDLHFKNGQIRKDKSENVSTIIEKVKNDKDIVALLVPGDLTDNGTDGAQFPSQDSCLLKFIPKNWVWNYGGSDNQLDTLKTEFVEKIQPHVPVYLGIGNHDIDVPKFRFCNPIKNYINQRHGSNYYSFEKNDTLFICLGLCPDLSNIGFLWWKLYFSKQKHNVIYFHYNLEGEYSGYWADWKKKMFYEIIKWFPKKITCICVGHLHMSQQTNWKGFQVISGAGSQVTLCEIKPNNDIFVSFLN